MDRTAPALSSPRFRIVGPVTINCVDCAILRKCYGDEKSRGGAPGCWGSSEGAAVADGGGGGEVEAGSARAVSLGEGSLGRHVCLLVRSWHWLCPQLPRGGPADCAAERLLVLCSTR